MTEKQLYGVLIRTVGVILRALSALYMLPWLLLMFAQVSGPCNVDPRLSIAENLLYALGLLIIGSLMVRLPELIVRISWYETPAPAS